MMVKTATVKAFNGRQAIFLAAKELELPRTAKVKTLDRVDRTRWKVVFE